MAARALEERHLQPLTRALRPGERDLARRPTKRFQYRAGSGPPEPPGKVARFDWAGGPTRVLVTFEEKGAAKSAAYVSHERLPDPAIAETAKAAWKQRLTALKSLLESTDV